MDYTGAGGKKGQPQQNRAYSQSESRHPQHPAGNAPLYQQQQQHPGQGQAAALPQQLFQDNTSQQFARQMYPQQDYPMTSVPQAMDHEYLRQHGVAGHQPQYMQQPYAAMPNYGAPSRYPTQPQAAPHPQTMAYRGDTVAYQQQVALQQAAYSNPQMYMGQPQPQVPSQQAIQQPYLQPKIGRLPADRPLIKLSVSLIETYKSINTVYYEEREARRAARAKDKTKKGQGTNNNGWDDENYDYIVTADELFHDRYRIKERIGKGSFGQVVRAEDASSGTEVAIKIIKSKKPFQMQAKTEIELLTHLNRMDPEDQHNVVRLLTHFMYRGHQCLVFEMLSLNLYELLKNTQFGGVSLNLIRKFAKQVLKSLTFLARRDVDIIHCDLKPENILLRHPKKSGIKVIDFGSSCRSEKRMYSYIQSRFYRSPEVMLGLPYAVSIDVWSLGCILAEMHTGEPLFSGSDQFDQMQKIVKLLGVVPSSMIVQANDQHRNQFFEKVPGRGGGNEEWTIKQQNTTASSSRGGSSSSAQPQQPATSTATPSPAATTKVVPSPDPKASLMEVIRGDGNRKKKYPPTETGNSDRNYELFVDLIYRMLSFDPKQRIKPEQALVHPFITESSTTSSSTSAGGGA